MCSTIIILFCAPKQGGILQSSGFLDLKSLMALGQTCKDNLIDELSLIVLIENEITRDHKVQTKEDAIALWQRVRSEHSSVLKPWLDRDCTSAAPAVNVTRDMLVEAASYEVMFAKMVRAIPQLELEQILNQVEEDYTAIYHAIQSDSNGVDPS